MSSKSAAHFNLRSPWNQPQRRQGGRRTKPPAGCQAAGSGQKPLQRPGGRKAKTHLSQHERPRCQRPAHLKISHAKLGIGASKAAVSPVHAAIRLRLALTRVEIGVSPPSRFHEWTREALETPALARYLPGPSARYVARARGPTREKMRRAVDRRLLSSARCSARAPRKRSAYISLKSMSETATHGLSAYSSAAQNK